MRKPFFVFLSVLIVGLLVLAACQPATSDPTDEPTEEMTDEPTEEMTDEPTEEPTEEMTEEPTEEMTEEPMDTIQSICLVTDLGSVTDGTFNQYAYEGMVLAVDEFGLESTFIETQSQTDYEANVNTCVSEEYDIIVTVGFLIGDVTFAAAEANSDIYFIGIDQFYGVEGVPENLVGITFREDHSGFMAGVLAALMTETDIVAGVYGIDIPPVVKFRNGFENGVAYTNPDVTALGTYIDDFLAPDRGASAAEQFMGEGADVIFGAGGPTGTGGIKRAAEEGVYVIGVDQDEYFTSFGSGETPGAEFLISSAMKRVDLGVYDMVAALMNDMAAFEGGGHYTLSVANGGIAMAPSHDATVPQEVLDELDVILQGLIDGSIETGVDPVTGELLD